MVRRIDSERYLGDADYELAAWISLLDIILYEGCDI